MDPILLKQFLLGIAVTLCSLIGLIFLRFWRKAKDRLFLCFAISFWLLGINWLALSLIQKEESQSLLYIIRLIAFLILLVGIWDKNRVRAK